MNLLLTNISTNIDHKPTKTSTTSYYHSVPRCLVEHGFDPPTLGPVADVHATRRHDHVKVQLFPGGKPASYPQLGWRSKWEYLIGTFEKIWEKSP